MRQIGRQNKSKVFFFQKKLIEIDLFLFLFFFDVWVCESDNLLYKIDESRKSIFNGFYFYFSPMFKKKQ